MGTSYMGIIDLYNCKIEQRPFFSIIYYNLAKEYADKAKQEKADKNPGLPQVNARKYSIISIIFSALTLEASINDIGITCLGKEFFREVDQLNLCKKYIVFAKLLSKKGEIFNKSKQPYEKLKKLSKLRNDLVHYKSFFEEIKGNRAAGTKLEKCMNSQTAEYFLQAIEEILREFQKITQIKETDIPVLEVIEVQKTRGDEILYSVHEKEENNSSI